MALPTLGRVIIETTVGELDIELWSKVLYRRFFLVRIRLRLVAGNTKDMSQLYCTGSGRHVLRYKVF